MCYVIFTFAIYLNILNLLNLKGRPESQFILDYTLVSKAWLLFTA